MLVRDCIHAAHLGGFLCSAYNQFQIHIVAAKRATRLEARRGADSPIYGCIQLINEKEQKGAKLREKISSQPDGDEGLADSAGGN
ncbi:MAG: hypothetical protein Q8O24_03250 [Gallionellaceae bacterium]|nr:hypothetical protein [Gallionellaceae bacterium]